MVIISIECSSLKFHSVLTFCENFGNSKEIGIVFYNCQSTQLFYNCTKGNAQQNVNA
jgi:hypothetical protein